MQENPKKARLGCRKKNTDAPPEHEYLDEDEIELVSELMVIPICDFEDQPTPGSLFFAKTSVTLRTSNPTLSL